MITAAIHGVAVARNERNYDLDTETEIGRIAAEIAERMAEMEQLRAKSAMRLVNRLSSVAQLDSTAPGTFSLVIDVLHGRTERLLDSYAAQADSKGVFKQTMHYRTKMNVAALQALFPEIACVMEQIRTSVEHHEEPKSNADAIRGDLCE